MENILIWYRRFFFLVTSYRWPDDPKQYIQ